MKLWHCHNSRSLRPLWTLEALGLDYEIELMPFPPRLFKKDFLDVNVLGTVPYFEDGEINMTESVAICHYLEQRYGKGDLSVSLNHPEYGDFLNWLYHADATLLFPQTLVFRYSLLEPEERRSAQVVEDYSKWFIARLRRLDAHIENREFLVGNKFTIADICIAYALHFGDQLKLSREYQPQTMAYLQRLREREIFQRIEPMGAELSPFAQ